MSLLEQIQNDAVDSRSDLASLLRRCKILAARLGNKNLEEWLVWESNGYPRDVELPDYRVRSIQLKGHFAGPFGSGIRNATIPSGCLPEQLRETFTQFRCRRSVACIEQLLKDKKSNSLGIPFDNLAALLGEQVYEDQNCYAAWGELDAGQLVEVLNTVRNRILDFVLAIWKEEPLAGDEPSDAHKIEPAKINQIFNTTVYGGAANLVGSATHSTVAFGVEANDFSSLEVVLRENSIANEDIAELKEAIETEPTRPSASSFGPRVAAWISKMIEKAASGVWQIGVGAAGNLLAEAIGKYYGM